MTAIPPRLKKTVFALITVGLACGTLELAAWFMYSLVSSQGYSADLLAKEKEKAVAQSRQHADQETKDAFMDSRIFHPFLGYIYLPNSPVKFDMATPVAKLFSEPCETNSMGYFGDPEPGKRENIVEVLILGGSLANLVQCYSSSHIIGELSKVPAFRGKQFAITGFGICGYKQPQHLLALTYLLAQGKRPDVVINLDGFNEVVINDLIGGKGPDRASFPLFPERWTAAFPARTVSELSTIGRIANLRMKRAGWAKLATGVGRSRNAGLTRLTSGSARR